MTSVAFRDSGLQLRTHKQMREHCAQAEHRHENKCYNQDHINARTVLQTPASVAEFVSELRSYESTWHIITLQEKLAQSVRRLNPPRLSALTDQRPTAPIRGVASVESELATPRIKSTMLLFGKHAEHGLGTLGWKVVCVGIADKPRSLRGMWFAARVA